MTRKALVISVAIVIAAIGFGVFLYLDGTFDRLFLPAFVFYQQAAFYDYGVLVAVAAIIGFIGYKAGYWRCNVNHRKINAGSVIWVIVAAVFIFLVAVGIALAILIFDKTQAPLAGTTLTIGAGIVVLVVNTGMAARRQRRQHTLNVLTTMRQTDRFMNSLYAMSSQCPPGTDLSHSHAAAIRLCLQTADTYEAALRWSERPNPGDEANQKHYIALTYVLNYYEFLAAGVNTGDLDDELLRRSHGNVIVRTFHRYHEYLKVIWGQDSPKDRNSTYFELYELVVNRWGTTIDDLKDADGPVPDPAPQTAPQAPE